MSYQEKNQIISIISSILITAIYFIVIFQKYIKLNEDLANSISFWATVLLVFILISAVVKILLTIIFTIIYSIATKQEDPSLEDERDKLIELKASRISQWIFLLGFVLAMISQAIKMPLSVMFMTFVIFGLISDVMDSVTKLLLYKKGV